MLTVVQYYAAATGNSLAGAGNDVAATGNSAAAAVNSTAATRNSECSNSRYNAAAAAGDSAAAADCAVAGNSAAEVDGAGTEVTMEVLLFCSIILRPVASSASSISCTRVQLVTEGNNSVTTGEQRRKL